MFLYSLSAKSDNVTCKAVDTQLIKESENESAKKPKTSTYTNINHIAQRVATSRLIVDQTDPGHSSYRQSLKYN